eukprot:1193137-Prorocentrum_minimum.AAC.5
MGVRRLNSRVTRWLGSKVAMVTSTVSVSSPAWRTYRLAGVVSSKRSEHFTRGAKLETRPGH